MASEANMHASAVLVGDRGVLITGASGAGKTRLALELVREAERRGRLGRLVADDQALLSSRGGRLVARVPASIAGLCEIRGLGLVAAAHEPACVIDLLVRLVPAGEAPRLPENLTETIKACSIPVLRLAERDAAGAVLGVMAFLDAPVA